MVKNKETFAEVNWNKRVFYMLVNLSTFQYLKTLYLCINIAPQHCFETFFI